MRSFRDEEQDGAKGREEMEEEERRKGVRGGKQEGKGKREKSRKKMRNKSSKLNEARHKITYTYCKQEIWNCFIPE